MIKKAKRSLTIIQQTIQIFSSSDILNDQHNGQLVTNIKQQKKGKFKLANYKKSQSQALNEAV